MKIAVTLIIQLFALSLAMASETYRNHKGSSEIRLASREGLEIVMRSQMFQSGYIGSTQLDTAEQIQVAVRGSNVSTATRGIRAVLTPNCISGRYGWPVEKPTLFIDLQPKMARGGQLFVGASQEALVLRSAIHGGEWINCHPQLAIVVDGAWQTDPINGSHNFNLNF